MTALGRTFIHPVFDAAIIGGGLSILAIPVLIFYAGSVDAMTLSLVLLAANSAHFGASTVRLYTKPGATTDWPFVSAGLPLVTLATLTLCIALGDLLGSHLYALAMTWSPFHYAAQAYGLSMVYCRRSGYTVSEAGQRWLYAACMLPFLHAFAGSSGAGIEWFVAPSVLADPMVATVRGGIVTALALATFAGPVLAFWSLQRSAGSWPPMIVALLIASNGMWWVVFPYTGAFAWATVFHGLQYLAIVLIFHVKEQTSDPGNTRSPFALSLRFYLLSLGLAYGLFHALPAAYTAVGFAHSESILLVVAMINIHHFIVDRYIWRVRRDARNAVVVRT